MIIAITEHDQIQYMNSADTRPEHIDYQCRNRIRADTGSEQVQDQSRQDQSRYKIRAGTGSDQVQDQNRYRIRTGTGSEQAQD